METIETKIPIQYSPAGALIKRFLHTRWGARLGFFLGVSGFNQLELKVTRKNGELEYVRSFNSRVDKGADLTASLLSGTSFNSIASPLPPKYIALSTSVLTPAKGDTTLSGETVVSGLARALGTQGTYTGPSVLDGSASYVVSNIFTAGGSATIASAALFDAASSGNMFVEANASSSKSITAGDLLTVTWTINL